MGMITSSMAFLLLSVLYIMVDASHWTGSPFVYAGMNSIVLYCGHIITYNMSPSTWWWATCRHTRPGWWSRYGAPCSGLSSQPFYTGRRYLLLSRVSYGE